MVEVSRLPVFNWALGIAYKVVSYLRLPLNGPLLAARRLRSETSGKVRFNIALYSLPLRVLNSPLTLFWRKGEEWECGDDDDEGCEVPDDW